jgi:hypothetical protein
MVLFIALFLLVYPRDIGLTVAVDAAKRVEE